MNVYKQKTIQCIMDSSFLPRIYDIQTFHHQDVENNAAFIRGFTVWSSLFNGYYFHLNVLRIEKKKTQKTLALFIKNYNDKNGIKNNVKTQRLTIPCYIQQLFWNLVQKLKHEKSIFIIKSEYHLLSTTLKNELFTFQDDDDDKKQDHQTPINLTPFLSSLTTTQNIKFLDQYIWILDEEQVHSLKFGKKDEILIKLNNDN